MTPEQRTARAKIAAHTLHAHLADPAAHTRPARQAFEQRFLNQVDPNRELPEQERQRRAAHARRAYYIALSAKGVAARRTR